MFIENNIVVLSITLGVALCSPTVVAMPPTEKYSITLSRASHVGDVTSWEEDKRIVTTNFISVAGQGESKHKMTVTLHMEACDTVMAVNANGGVARITCDIKKLTTDYGKGPHELFPPGSIITAEFDKQHTVYTSKDRKLSKEQTDMLSLLINLDPPDSPTFDEAFGFGQPLPVGARLHADSQKLMEMAHAHGGSVDKNDFSGEASFVGLQTVNGEQCATIELSLTSHNYRPPAAKGITSDLRNSTFAETLIAPIDPTKQIISEEYRNRMEAKQEGTVPDGKSFSGHAIMTFELSKHLSDVAQVKL